MSAAGSVVLLTSAGLPDLAPDDQLLAAACRAAGWRVTVLPWRDAAPQADAAVVRSCWDYTDDPAGFLAALERVAERMPLWNPIETIRWNLDKRYLLELAGQGIPVPATRVVETGASPGLDTVCDDLAADEVVVKPLVGAGGTDTWRIPRADRAGWSALPPGRTWLVQPFLPEVLTGGEVSLAFLDGAYSHAVIKHAAAGEFRVQEEHGGVVAPWTPSPDLVATATAAVAAIPHPWRYARVDGILTARGFQLMELELVEPELFFRFGPGSAERFVTGTARGVTP